MSFSQLLNKQRVNISKKLLQNTDKYISEIWEAVGFGSAQNFAIAFKKYTGTSPSEYREQKQSDTFGFK
jgi:two-component system response regulator YesN